MSELWSRSLVLYRSLFKALSPVCILCSMKWEGDCELEIGKNLDESKLGLL
jgi:hypothetical protein